MPKQMTRKPMTRVRISLTEEWRPLKRIFRGRLVRGEGRGERAHDGSDYREECDLGC